MNRDKTKGFLSGLLVTAMLFTLGISALSFTGSMSIDVAYKDIKLVVDGTKVEPKDGAGNAVEPFIYNGTTYLPVRAVGNAVGKDVSWDANTNTVYLGKQPAGGAEYSRSNPAPVGTEQTITVNNSIYDYTATVKVTDIIEGDAAWNMIKAANMFNKAPEAGKKYILAKIKVSAQKVKDDKALSVSSYNFEAFSASNTEYATQLVVAPKPALQGDVYAGGSIEGYAAFCVDTNDTAPKIVFGRSYDGSGGIWFSLVK